MSNPYKFDKHVFRHRIEELVKLGAKVTIEDASPEQIYRAFKILRGEKYHW